MEDERSMVAGIREGSASVKVKYEGKAVFVERPDSGISFHPPLYRWHFSGTRPKPLQMQGYTDTRAFGQLSTQSVHVNHAE